MSEVEEVAVSAAREHGCVCPCFRDTGGFRVSDLTCPLHGVNGTHPGDGLWAETNPGDGCLVLVPGTGAAEGGVHELKCLPDYFAAVLDGSKPFELRRNDRGFKEGDILALKEWSPKGGYSGRSCARRVSYLLSGVNWLVPGVVAMGLEDASPEGGYEGRLLKSLVGGCLATARHQGVDCVICNPGSPGQGHRQNCPLREAVEALKLDLPPLQEDSHG